MLPRFWQQPLRAGSAEPTIQQTSGMLGTLPIRWAPALLLMLLTISLKSSGLTFAPGSSAGQNSRSISASKSHFIASMTDSKKEIWLIRHGETEWSAKGMHTSRTDLPLLPSGIRQAEELREKLNGRKFALVMV